MKEYLRQEIEIWEVIPAIRRELSNIMVDEYRLTQREAATRLGVTEAAVSYYRASKRARAVSFTKKLSQEMRTSVEHMMKGGNSIQEEMCRLFTSRDMKVLVCRMHKMQSKVPKNCKVCLT
jgi:predicted transcriptional regulator